MRKKYTVFFWIIGIFSFFTFVGKPLVDSAGQTVPSVPTQTPVLSIPTVVVTLIPSMSPIPLLRQSRPSQSDITPIDQTANNPTPKGPTPFVEGNHMQSSGDLSANSAPEGATAKCNDGTYSFSQHTSDTCKDHGGVLQWYE